MCSINYLRSTGQNIEHLCLETSAISQPSVVPVLNEFYLAVDHGNCVRNESTFSRIQLLWLEVELSCGWSEVMSEWRNVQEEQDQQQCNEWKWIIFNCEYDINELLRVKHKSQQAMKRRMHNNSPVKLITRKVTNREESLCCHWIIATLARQYNLWTILFSEDRTTNYANILSLTHPRYATATDFISFLAVRSNEWCAQ